MDYSTESTKNNNTNNIIPHRYAKIPPGMNF